jgi:hypothetical protein
MHLELIVVRSVVLCPQPEGGELVCIRQARPLDPPGDRAL